MKYLYACFTYAYAFPLAIVALIRGLLLRTADTERIAVGLPRVDAAAGRPFWLVASSVGEVSIALKLTARLKSKFTAPILLTVTTATGKRHAEDSAVRPDIVCYHPFDLTGIVRNFIAHFRPRAIVLIETELWPALMTAAHEGDVPVVQVSGRISEKSIRRYLGLRAIFAPLLQRCRGLWMQSPDDAERIVLLGAPPEIVESVGSVKEDYVAPDKVVLAEIRNRLSSWDGQRLFVCGSTRPGEEAVLLAGYQRLRETFTDLKLLLVPRHPDRLSEIVELTQHSECRFQLWSENSLRNDTDVLIVDAIGVLNAIYHLTHIAFVGGTLAEIGGHNLLEPALAGCPVLYGPHFFQQQRGHELLQQHQMGYLVHNAEEIAAVAARILKDRDTIAEYANRSQRLREGSSHVLDEYIARILAIDAEK